LGKQRLLHKDVTPKYEQYRQEGRRKEVYERPYPFRVLSLCPSESQPSQKSPNAVEQKLSIRVFVLPPKPKKEGDKEVVVPLDLQEGEEFLLDEKGPTPQLSRSAARQALCRVSRKWPAPRIR
jgi:hypothetical protein